MKRLLLVISLAGLFTISSCASVEPARVTAAAQRLQAVFPKWELLPVSSTPDVTVLGHEGYRIILRHTWPEYPVDTLQQRSATSGQQQYRPSPRPAATAKPIQSVTEYQHIQCVLFPAPVTEPLAVRDAIPWQDLAQVQYVRPFYAGSGQGFTWFCRTAVWEQDHLRQELSLQGGEDRLQLAYDFLKVPDKNMGTAHSSVSILASAGQEGLAYIRKAAQECPQELARGLGALQLMHEERITNLLCELYRSENSRLSRTAEFELTCPPYRAGAKSIYLEMFKNTRYSVSACEACAEFDWKEAIPMVNEICTKPDNWRQYHAAYEARRSLAGNPIPKELRDAEQAIRHAAFHFDDPADVEKAREAKATLLSSQDREGVTVIATGLAIARGKFHEKFVRQTGLELLQQVPKPLAYDFVRRMANAIQDQNDHPDLVRLEQALAPQQ